MKKTITVEIDNEWLDSLEDLLVCTLTAEQELEHRKTVLQLWRSLVTEYDKDELDAHL